MGRKKKICEKCKYRWEYTAFGWSEWGCQYIIVEGKPRECECNDNCEKFKKKKEIENVNYIRGETWNRQKGTYYIKFITIIL